jgi:hypothetical protein
MIHAFIYIALLYPSARLRPETPQEGAKKPLFAFRTILPRRPHSLPLASSQVVSLLGLIPARLIGQSAIEEWPKAVNRPTVRDRGLDKYLQLQLQLGQESN